MDGASCGARNSVRLKLGVHMTQVTLPNAGIIAGFLPDEDGWDAEMNRNLRVLDAVTQLRVLDKDLSAPPGSPAAGDAYIIGASPTGAWASHANHIALWQVGDDITSNWTFVLPHEGWKAYVDDENVDYRYSGSAWVIATSGSGTVESIVAGTGITVDDTDPANPIVNATGGSDAAPSADLVLAVSDMTTALTTGTSIVYVPVPRPGKITAVKANLNVASSSGSVEVDILKNGVSILSTKLKIDASELTSLTAAIAAVISDDDLAADDQVSISILSAGTGAKGLIVTILFTQDGANLVSVVAGTNITIDNTDPQNPIINATGGGGGGSGIVETVTGTAPIVVDDSDPANIVLSITNVTTSDAGAMSAADKVKLNGIATSATANDTDANLKNRANHTGSQAQSTITNLVSDLAAKVDTGDSRLSDARQLAAGTEKTKLDYITVTQAVDLDDMESRIALLDTAIILKGSWSAAGGTFPGSGVAQAGWSYIVSADGTVGGVAFKTNDRLIAIVDNASTTVFASNWFKADYTDEVQSVHGRTGAVVAVSGDYTTDQVTEGSNLYFTAARVRSALLTGLSLATNQVIAATDTVLQALGYLQKQITDLATTVGGHFANPMTTAGDLIKGGVSGAASRLGIGSTGQVLTVVAGAPAWSAAVETPSVRQTVLSGPVDSSTGYPAFGGSTGSATLTTAATLKATCMAGGDLNYIGTIVNPAFVAPASGSGNGFFMLAITSAGVVTTSVRTLQTVYQEGGTYSTTNGQVTCNIQEGTLKAGNGSSAAQVYEVCIGECSYASGVWSGSPTWYAMRGSYYSGWFAVGASTTYTKSHNLGVPPREFTIMFADDTAGSNQRLATPLTYDGVAFAGWYGYNANTRLTCNVRASSNPGLAAGSGAVQSSGAYAFLVKRGW